MDSIWRLLTATFKLVDEEALSIKRQIYLILPAKIIYLKNAFKILPQLQQEESYHLIVEVGADTLSLVYFTKEPLCIQALYVHHIDKNTPASQLAEELEEYFRTENLPGQLSCHICYNFKECTPIPTVYFKQGNLTEMMDVLYGENNKATSSAEVVKGMDMALGYRLNKEIDALLQSRYPGAVTHHSLALQIAALGKEQDGLFCSIYQHSIKVVLFKNGVLQIARFFDYATPSDVAYHLLNVCAQHEVSPAIGRLVLSGFIDQKSNLYEELHRYFLNIELYEVAGPVTTAQAVSQYPVHFFSPLTLLATCVS